MSLTGEEIATIITACKKSDVIAFEMGDLHIQFGLNKLKDAKELAQVSIAPKMAVPNVDLAPLSEEELKQASGETEQQPLDDEELMHISDPIQWEKNQLTAAGSAEEN